MKKLFLAFLAVGSIATAQAQKAGSILLYGNAGVLANSNVDDYPASISGDQEVRTLQWSVNPGVGFQITKNFTVGASFQYAGQRVTNDDNTAGNIGNVVTRDRILAVGPFMRYTMPLSRTFFAFHQLDLNYLNVKTTNEAPGVPDNIDRTQGFRAMLTPAFGINVTNSIALNFGIGGIGYQTLVTDYDLAAMGETRSNTFAVTLGRQFNWGVSVNLGGYRHRGNAEPGSDTRRMNAYDEDEDDAPRRKVKVKIEEED